MGNIFRVSQTLQLSHKPLGEWNSSKNMRNKENICQYCIRKRAITALSLNAYLNEIYQELPYLLIVSDLLNII